MAFLPAAGDGIGVVLLLNTDSSAKALSSVTNKVVENALGIQGDDGSGVIVGVDQLRLPFQSISQGQKPRKQRYVNNFEVAAERYAGTYRNPGYGFFELCAPSSNSAYCMEVLSDFASVDGQKINASAESPKLWQLYGAWPRTFSSHIRVLQTSPGEFGFAIEALYPHGYGKNESPFQMEAIVATTEFLYDNHGEVKGLGLFQLTGEKTEQEKGPGSVEERADVWFEKADR